MQTGDRVYDKEHNANGYIIESGSQMSKVQYFWAKYSRLFPPRRIWQKATPDKQAWVNNTSLILTPKPIGHNKVTMFGTRSLDKLIRLICEIPYRRQGDESDIIIHYGNGHSYAGDALVINSNPIWNKYKQCNLLGNLAPKVLNDPRDGMDGNDWIVKPFQSIGGHGIANWDGMNHHGKYLQKKVTKVREFRAHCFLWANPKVPLIQEKMISDRDQLCWNKKQGSTFHYPHQIPDLGRNNLEPELVERITNMSIEALKKLKYDFGGIDFGLDDNGELFIFEVNSRMGLREMSFATYKNIMWQLYDLDIDDYKANRWEPLYRPVLPLYRPILPCPCTQSANPNDCVNPPSPYPEQTEEARGSWLKSTMGEAQECVMPKKKYQSFNLADREVNCDY